MQRSAFRLVGNTSLTMNTSWVFILINCKWKNKSHLNLEVLLSHGASFFKAIFNEQVWTNTDGVFYIVIILYIYYIMLIYTILLFTSLLSIFSKSKETVFQTVKINSFLAITERETSTRSKGSVCHIM